MNIKNLNKNHFYRFFLKIPLGVFFVSYVRFLYFVYIKKSLKTLYPQDKIPDKMAQNKQSGENAQSYNMWYLTKHFSLKDYYINVRKFTGERLMTHIHPLRAIDFLRFSKMKVLSVGPRNESEIFKLVSVGFKLENIESIDLHTYSKLITLGDMANIPFDRDKFDLVIVGWVLVYTNEIEKSIKELIRVTKNNGIISICSSHGKKIRKVFSEDYIESSEEILGSSNKILSFFNNSIGDVIFKYHPFDENNKDHLNSKRSNYLIKIKK